MLRFNIGKNLLLKLVLLVAVGILPLPAAAAETGGFFSQGQAVYDAQDLAKSQQEALQDLMVQGVTQALASLLSPSQMGSHYPAIQSKILKQPERYIESYQVFSENPAGGLYRITGQVNVAMSALKRDVEQLGLTAAPVSEAAPAAPEQTVQPQEAAAPRESVAPPPPPEPYPVQSETGQPMPASEQRVLWAVAEKWDSSWILPESSGDSRCFFVLSVLQESQDYPWLLNFPQGGSLALDTSGHVARAQLLALAGSSGTQSAISGTVSVRQDSGQGPAVEVFLQVIDVTSGQSKGEIRKEMPMGNATYQEGAIKMAYLLVPQLDRLLRAASSAAVPAPATMMTPGGVWTVLIRADYPYFYWEELEQVLRDRFASLQVNKLQVSRDLAEVQVEGLGTEFFTLLQEGILLRDGTRMQLGSYSPENRSVELRPVKF
ncbi:hypothetical protein [Desulfoferrobacter suflitae]|uniref:hypothetical protein n=1 Tax=Desulfoferrobacter suflitae TaxID=2865782 RepID=UPI002164EF26|nr:hypothetical protein [Desulfoferrobacter suflitae]MCK8602551.1 hypothetical protein [Desulfoferrobacter suflitae]